MLFRYFGRRFYMILDGAEVIAISKRNDFGVIKYADNSMKPIPIKYLAICRYENDKSVYLFFCNDKIEVENDFLFDTIEEAKQCALQRNKHVIWEMGILYISFEDVDFLNGEVERIESFGQDMLEIRYPDDYMIDVGFNENIDSFVITIVKNNDWINLIKEFKAKSDIELKRKLREAIQWIKTEVK
jgi:hypothetical protein